MPGTVKVWWHDGATKDVRYNELPVVNEPELGFESVAVGMTAASTGPAHRDTSRWKEVMKCDRSQLSTRDGPDRHRRSDHCDHDALDGRMTP